MKKITSLFLFALLLAACDTSGAQPAQPPPLSTAIPSLTPVIATNTEPPPPTPEVVIDKSGPLSDLARKNIEGGKYALQVDRLKALHSEWVKNGFISPETNQIVFLEDQNHDPDGVFAALMSRDGSQYIFPPLALAPNESPVPAYENTRYGLEPLKVNKSITQAEVSEMLRLGHSQEMANFLVGTDFAIRGRQFTRVRNGEVVAYIGPEGKWVKEYDWPICTDRSCAENFEVTDEMLNSGEFLDFAKRHDASGPFDMSKVIFTPITSNTFESGYNTENVSWVRTEALPNPAELYRNNKEARSSVRVAWGNWIFDKQNGYNRLILQRKVKGKKTG